MPSLDFAVVPVLLSPLQVLLTILPGLLVALATSIFSLLRPRAMLHLLHIVWEQKIPLLILALCGAGLVWTGQHLLRGLGPTANAAEMTSTDWPMGRGGLTRTGTPDGQGPTQGGLNWVWKKSEEAFLSSPAVVGNRVYVASASLGVFGQSGTIYCFDADTGAVVWQAAPEGYRPTFSSPVVAGHYLVCGEGLHDTKDSRVICLDLTPGKEGQVVWTHETKSHVECTPVVSQGKVYVNAGDDGIYCLELEPGADRKGRVVWHQPGEKFLDAETSLAVHGERVYVGLGLGTPALCVLDAATGTELKRLPMPYPVFGPPTIVDNKLFLGMGNGDYVKTAQDKAGEVRCIDLSTLTTRWSFRVGETVLGAIAAPGDHLYFGSRDGWVYCLDQQGKLVNKWNSHGPIATSPAVTPTHVYVVNASGVLYALERQTLEPVWEFRLGTQPLFISSPVVARGRVYVGSQHDGFLCAGAPGQEKPTPLWSGRLGGPGRGGNLNLDPLPEMGVFQWQYHPTDSPNPTDRLMQAPAAAVGATLLVPMAGGSRRGLALLPADVAINRAPAALWFHPTRHGVIQSPAMTAKLALVVDGREGDEGRSLTALELASGNPQWTVPIEKQATGFFTAVADGVYVQDRAGQLSGVDLQGTLTWTRSVGKLIQPVTVTETMLLAATVDPPELCALDRPTGIELWRVKLATPGAAPLLGLKKMVLVPTAKGVEARSLVDGAAIPTWKVEGGGVATDVILGGDYLAYINTRGELVVLARNDGAVRGRIPEVLPTLPPVPLRGGLLVAGAGKLVRVRLDALEEAPAVWMEMEALGAITAPAILHDSALYLGVAGRGLVRLGKGSGG